MSVVANKLSFVVICPVFFVLGCQPPEELANKNGIPMRFGDLEFAALQELYQENFCEPAGLEQGGPNFFKMQVKRSRLLWEHGNVTHDPFLLWLNLKMFQLATNKQLFEISGETIRLRLPNSINDVHFSYFIEVETETADGTFSGIVPMQLIWRFNESEIGNPQNTEVIDEGEESDKFGYDDLIELKGVKPGDFVKLNLFRSTLSKFDGSDSKIKRLSQLSFEDASKEFDIRLVLSLYLPVFLDE